MADPVGHSSDAVTSVVTSSEQARKYSLFALLRAIEKLHADQPRLGESRRPSDDPVRLQQPPLLGFVDSEVAGISQTPAGLMRIEEYSFGLFGPNGPLPLHLTEVAHERQRQHNDGTVVDFFNLLQHRLIALFYRAWAEADPAAQHDRPDQDRFRLYVGGLLGLGFDTSTADASLDRAKLNRVSRLSLQTRSPAGLEAVLSDYFELPFRVRSFVGSWLDIPPSARTQLGGARENASLGIGTTLGAASWQSQHQFEIGVGPLALETFERFLPGTRALRELSALVRFYTNDEWSWLLRLQLQADEVPPVRLGGARLGWTSWMGGRKSMAEDVILRDSLCDA